MSKSRVYVVTDAENVKSLVRAVSAAQAIRFIASNDYHARPAKVDDILTIGADDVSDATKGHDDV